MESEYLPPRLVAAAREFTDWREELLVASDKENVIQEPLYHYTDASGLAGIIKNQEMWFTNIYHLNDPSELRYGLDIALEIVKAERKEGNEAIKFACEMYEDVHRNGINRDAIDFFVASFTHLNDDLGQWRAYADNGRGFALGLSPHLFRTQDEAELKDIEKFFVLKVNYNRVKTHESLHEAITRALAIIGRESEAGSIKSQKEGFEFVKYVLMNLSIAIIWVSATAKHPAYKDESEIRLLMINSNSGLTAYIDTRKRGPDLVPFIKSPLPVREDNGITEIVVGPSAGPEAEHAVRSLLKSQNVSEDIPIRKSEIPYRAT